MAGLMRWLATWPVGRLHRLGALLGWLAWLGSGDLRRTVREQASAAGVSAPQQRKAIAQMGMMMAEVPLLWFGGEAAMARLSTRWEGADLIDLALQGGKGLIIMTPHLGCMELAPRMYAQRFGAAHPITVLYRPARKAWLDGWSRPGRTHPGMSAAPATTLGVRAVLRALREGHAVGILPDQVPPEGQGVWAPFFGQPAYTMTLVGRLVRQTGCAVLTAWCERGDGGCFTVHMRPFAERPQRVDAADEAAWDAAWATAINRAMERLIRECPEQYLWGYPRYKAPRGGRA